MKVPGDLKGISRVSGGLKRVPEALRDISEVSGAFQELPGGRNGNTHLH